MALHSVTPYVMKEANAIFGNICLIAVVIACIIILIGIFPYIMRLLKGVHAAADSVSDMYRHSVRNKQSSYNHSHNYNYSLMAKKTNPDELHIDPDEVRIDKSELDVTLPEVALSNQFKVMEVNKMHAEMIADINRKRPITEWGRERLINKIRHQNIKIELIVDQIGLHNTMIKEAAKLEATMLNAPQLVEHELEMLLLDQKFAKKRKIAQFIEEMDELEARRKFRDIDIKIKDAEHDRYIMETKLSELERKAQINMVLATTDQERARAALMEASLELFEKGELSEKLQAYLIISVFNPGEKSFVDLGADEELEKIIRKDKKYDAEKKKWEAKSTEQDFKHKKEKFKRQRRQFGKGEE